MSSQQFKHPRTNISASQTMLLKNIDQEIELKQYDLHSFV